MDSDVLYSTIDIRDSGSGIQHWGVIRGGQSGWELGVTSLSSYSFSFFLFFSFLSFFEGRQTCLSLSLFFRGLM